MSETKKEAMSFDLQPGLSAIESGKETVKRHHLQPIDDGPVYNFPTASQGDRHIPAASAGHCTTHAVLGKGAGQHVQGESWLEFRHQVLISGRPNVAALREQALFTFGWKRERKHFFDLFVTLTCGARIAYTIKPEVRLTSGHFLSDIAEIAWWVQELDFADETRLLTEAHLDRIELHNAHLFAALRDEDHAAGLAARAAIVCLTGGACRALRDLALDTGLAARGYRALLRLLRDGELMQVKREAITPATLVILSKELDPQIGHRPIGPLQPPTAETVEKPAATFAL